MGFFITVPYLSRVVVFTTAKAGRKIDLLLEI
jgi:hypothetical protein